MTTGSAYQGRMFTLAYGGPLAQSGAWLGELSFSVADYAHTIDVFGGFKQASIRLSVNATEIEEWLEEGIGRTIEVYDDATSRVWEGFVNRLSLRSGGLEVTRGPLIDVANRLFAIYSTIDTSTTPPTPGERKITATVNDTASQGRYGIWPKVLSLAGATDASADQLRDTYLAEHKDPETTSNFAPPGSEPTLSLDCLGYVYALGYPYNQTAATGTVDVDAKMRAILAADPNGWISTDYGRIAANTLAISQWENDNLTASALLKGLTAMGDAADNRYLFGIYEGRRAEYRRVSSTIDYTMELRDPSGAIRDAAGGEVSPWLVRPGTWMFFADFLPGRELDESDLRSDPRLLFVETVTFQAPGGIQLAGGKVGTLSQRLAQLGLAGLSA